MTTPSQTRTDTIAAAITRQGAGIAAAMWWGKNTVGPINVKEAQAVGNGIADDTVAIQAALDYAGSLAFSLANSTSAPGGYAFGASKIVVWIPEGVYLITETLTVPAGVSVHTDGVLNAQIADLWAFAIVFNSGASTSLLKINSVNQGCGVTFGELGQQNDCQIGRVRLWNIGNGYNGANGPQRGIVFQGFDYSFDSLEVNGGNIGIDFNQCSDVRGDKIISTLASTAVRMVNAVEHVFISMIDIDTPQYVGMQIDSSNDIRLSASVFINDNNNTGAIATAIIIGEYSSAASPVSFANLELKVSNTGGTALSVANIRNSVVSLVASNAPLNTGNNFNITEGISYGTRLDDSVVITAAIDPGVASPVVNAQFGMLNATASANLVTAGTTSGKITLYQKRNGALLKTVLVINAYENAAAGNVTIDLPIPYAANMYQTTNQGALPSQTWTLSSFTFDPAAATAYSGIVIFEGV